VTDQKSEALRADVAPASSDRGDRQAWPISRWIQRRWKATNWRLGIGERRTNSRRSEGSLHAALAAFMEDDPKYPRFNEQPGRQARLQERAAGTRAVDWHIAEKGAPPFFEKRVKVAPNFNVYHTPPEANWRLF
jgi:hypothetical protein